MTFLRIVRGTPDEVELAALTAVVAGLAAAPARPPAAPSPRSAWADPTRMLRQPTGHGPGAWRASGLPR